jgi:hypothetical protein
MKGNIASESGKDGPILKNSTNNSQEWQHNWWSIHLLCMSLMAPILVVEAAMEENIAFKN